MLHMLYEGVESRSDGVHRIQWTRIDSDGKVLFSIRERFRKMLHMLYDGVESRSDGVHRIHWTRIDFDGKVLFLFVRDLRKISHMLYESRQRHKYPHLGFEIV